MTQREVGVGVSVCFGFGESLRASAWEWGKEEGVTS